MGAALCELHHSKPFHVLRPQTKIPCPLHRPCSASPCRRDPSAPGSPGVCGHGAALGAQPEGTRGGLGWEGGGLPAPVPAPEPGRALHVLPAALAWCPQAFAELVQGHVPADSKLLCRPGRGSPGPWGWQQELNVSATGPLATTHPHPSWWTRTSATRSKQQRSGPGDRTGWAAVRERVCIAPHPPSSASPCGGTTPEPNSLGVGCPGTPRAF